MRPDGGQDVRMPRLDGGLSHLVPFTEQHLHAERYFAWLNDYEVMKTINRPEYLTSITFDEVVVYVEGLWKSKNDSFYALCLNADGRFIGTVRVAGLNWYSRVADVGIMIGDRSVWGRGIASDAIRTICGYLFEELGLRKLTAGAMANNPAVIRAFEKSGFVREGLLRQQDRFENGYVDHVYLGCFMDEFSRAVGSDRGD